MKEVEIIQKISYISNNLIVLQILKQGYLYELHATTLSYTLKNIRNGAVLEKIQEILQDLEPYMTFLIACDEGEIKMEDFANRQPYFARLVVDLTTYYDWAIKEIEIRNKRLDLINLEKTWLKNEY